LGQCWDQEQVYLNGKLGIGAEAQNAYINYLTDPGAYAKAQVTI